jgi:hypothetical protein
MPHEITNASTTVGDVHHAGSLERNASVAIVIIGTCIAKATETVMSRTSMLIMLFVGLVIFDESRTGNSLATSASRFFKPFGCYCSTQALC